MKTVEQLIEASREETGNTRYDSNSGLSQKLFVRKLQNAQNSLVISINNAHAKYFKKSTIVPVVNGQLKYDYPSDVVLQFLDTVLWSQRQSSNSWTALYLMTDKELQTATVGSAFGYIPEADGIVMNPPPRDGYLKMTYMFAPLNVQKKSGQVKTRIIQTGNILKALELDTTEKSYDECEINSDYFLCVTDKHGNIKARNIPYNSVESGQLNLDAFTMPAGETVDVGDFVLVGKNTTNVPKLPDICETYLLKYMNYEVKYGDSSNWTKEYREDLDRHFSNIASLFAKRSADISRIPITNTNYL